MIESKPSSLKFTSIRILVASEPSSTIVAKEAEKNISFARVLNGFQIKLLFSPTTVKEFSFNRTPLCVSATIYLYTNNKLIYIVNYI